MDIFDESSELKKSAERRASKRVGGDLKEEFKAFLKEHFEDPAHSDILVEKQLKEGRKKR